jgi:type I restriction enzyme, R subunit
MVPSALPVEEAPSSERRKLSELSRVRLVQDISDGAEVIPADSTGTVVHIYQDGEGLEVEFTTPRHAVLTLRSTQVRPF